MQVLNVTIGLPTPVLILDRAVRAGLPSPADDFIEDETFLVRVAGDSMVLAKLFNGDIAVVDRSLMPRNGDVVVVDVDGERSFKVWRRQGPRVTLHFANPRFPEFQLSPDAVIEVWGVVSGSVNPRRRSE